MPGNSLNNFTARIHSALIMNVIKLKGTAKLTTQGELVCLKNYKYTQAT